jgi:ribonuclease P protein component
MRALRERRIARESYSRNRHRAETRSRRFAMEQLQGQQSMMSTERSFSFSKARRLTHASEYERIKRDGLVRRGKLLTLSATAVENSGRCRVGFVTSRRLGSAVIRNRVRRRLREIVRQHQHHLRQDFWIVLIAKRDAANASYHALEDEWLRLARRASILL